MTVSALVRYSLCICRQHIKNDIISNSSRPGRRVVMKVEDLQKQINKYPAILYMKGTPDTAACGFSRRVCYILEQYNAEYAFVDVLAYPGVRANLPKVSNWPTFPQFFINGELIGGSDIIHEYHQEAKLEAILKNAGLIKDMSVLMPASMNEEG